MDATLWSRPCQKCHRRIDKCICPEGPTGYVSATTNDSVALPATPFREDSEELWDLLDKEPEEFKARLGLKEVKR